MFKGVSVFVPSFNKAIISPAHCMNNADKTDIIVQIIDTIIL